MAIAEQHVKELRAELDGRASLPGEPGYDAARSVWNAMIDRHPAIVVHCANVEDVRRALRFGRERGLEISIRGGGHNIAGTAVSEGGLMIDFSAMKAVRVDPATRRATVEPGATLADVDRATQAHGLAVPLGINSTTGIAGLTLGGGFGWLTRKYGMTVDQLRSARVVTADGQLRRTSATEEPDLFWAIRGGGGNFGVVVEFEFELHPCGPDVYSGLIVYPMSEAKSVLTQYRSLIETAPDELTVWVVARRAPPLPFLPAEVHGQPIVALAVFYAGAPEEGERLAAPFRRLGRAAGEHLGAQPYVAWQRAFDPLLTPGARNYWKSHNFTHLADGLFDAAIQFASAAPSPHCEVFIGQLGGQAGRVPANAMAYANRDANFVMNVHGRWERPEEDAAGIAWARRFFDATAPFATGGVYVNFMPADEGYRVPAAFGGNYDRLAALKHRFDPHNVFHINPNVPPAAPKQALKHAG